MGGEGGGFFNTMPWRGILFFAIFQKIYDYSLLSFLKGFCKQIFRDKSVGRVEKKEGKYCGWVWSSPLK